MAEVIKVDDCGSNIGDYDIPIHNAIIIPEGATNGDMIKVMFDVEIKHIFEDLNVVVIVLDGKTKVFDLDWWNAPYKKGVE